MGWLVQRLTNAAVLEQHSSFTLIVVSLSLSLSLFLSLSLSLSLVAKSEPQTVFELTPPEPRRRHSQA